MLWIKALHISFMVTWFAGLFYLPRLFIYHVESTDPISRERFVIMERRLYAIMSIGAVATAVFGVTLIVLLGGLNSPLWQMHWWYAKLAGVAFLVGYHLWCRRLMQGLADSTGSHSQRWYRWFNEVPVLLLLSIVVLVVVKPF